MRLWRFSDVEYFGPAELGELNRKHVSPLFLALLAQRTRSRLLGCRSQTIQRVCPLLLSTAARDYRRSQSIARLFPVNLRQLCATRESSHEGLRRNFDPTHHLHALLALFLPFEQLALSGDVAAIAFRQHILAHCPNSLARDHS